MEEDLRSLAKEVGVWEVGWLVREVKVTKEKIQSIFLPLMTLVNESPKVRNTSLGAGLLVLQIKIPSGIHLLGSSGGGICFNFFLPL